MIIKSKKSDIIINEVYENRRHFKKKKEELLCGHMLEFTKGNLKLYFLIGYVSLELRFTASFMTSHTSVS